IPDTIVAPFGRALPRRAFMPASPSRFSAASLVLLLVIGGALGQDADPKADPLAQIKADAAALVKADRLYDAVKLLRAIDDEKRVHTKIEQWHGKRRTLYCTRCDGNGKVKCEKC